VFKHNAPIATVERAASYAQVWLGEPAKQESITTCAGEAFTKVAQEAPVESRSVPSRGEKTTNEDAGAPQGISVSAEPAPSAAAVRRGARAILNRVVFMGNGFVIA
jgi:hypothetical protein